jgi:hypothetical protein
MCGAVFYVPEHGNVSNRGNFARYGKHEFIKLRKLCESGVENVFFRPNGRVFSMMYRLRRVNSLFHALKKSCK